MSRKPDPEVLAAFRKELRAYIKRNYRTAEEFCWDKNLNKATISNLLNSKKDFSIDVAQSRISDGSKISRSD